MKPLLGTLSLALSSLALAHEGHGMGAHHWHATDTIGFIAVGVALALLLWAIRRK